MKTRKVDLLVLLLVAGMLAACAGVGGGTTRLGSKDAGSTVHLKQGDTLEVSLDGNPTTGYTWELAPGSAGMLASQGEPEFKADSNALGSGGLMTLQFKAVSKGTGTLKLIYHRTFEPNVAPLHTFEVTVVVE